MKRNDLVENIRKRKSFLCVGLDPDMEKLPKHLHGCDNPFLEFNKAIIDATAPYAIAYKPNLAFYECQGIKGWEAFIGTVKYLRENYPDIFIIADAKRGDIGNTAKMYAKSFFEEIGVDAVTVAPYMGEDSVKPFLDYEGKWTILLALTSNKGSQDFQMIEDRNGKRVFERVIKRSLHWGTPINLMYVAGATQGYLLGDVRAIAPRSFLLVPGVGAQGGSLEEVCKYAMIDECGLIVNSSRGIIFVSEGEDFAEAAATKAKMLADQMADLLKKYGVI